MRIVEKGVMEVTKNRPTFLYCRTEVFYAPR